VIVDHYGEILFQSGHWTIKHWMTINMGDYYFSFDTRADLAY